MTSSNAPSSEHSPRTEPVLRTIREERSLTPMRKTIAGRLHESYSEAVHVTVSRNVNAEALIEAAESADTAYDEDIGIFDVLLMAVSDGLIAHPAFNSTFEGETHTLYEEHNVGVAVSLDEGLVTPVISAINEKSIDEIAHERWSLTDRVQTGEYSMSDLRGGTFTVSNLGPLGSDSFTPIINPPQVAILGVNRIRERPAVIDGETGSRREIGLDVSFDHRVVDGADAARFLDTLAEAVSEKSDIIGRW